jgi:hypothetical protein
MEQGISWEAITVAQSVKKLQPFYGTLRFITVFTGIHHLYNFFNDLFKVDKIFSDYQPYQLVKNYSHESFMSYIGSV